MCLLENLGLQQQPSVGISVGAAADPLNGKSDVKGNEFQ